MVLAAVLYAGYYFFIANNNSNLVIDEGVNEGEVLASEFLVRLNEIEDINFSRELFEDPRFRSLVSFSTAPEPASSGRANPFAQ